ncbi:DNA polymerase III subunit psi [Celerinatantimonas sp. MCCC 1A17872]|uniref:DNA polymerase III subunit psi n=1 Tax=Celerinatantimonas sp. MCCC 1A17872 TaxID=3177514 RepID=UPI0038C26B05
MQQRSIALLQQMGIPVWLSCKRENSLTSVPLLWVHDNPDALKASPLWQGVIVAIGDKISDIVVVTAEQSSHYLSPTIIWTSEQPPMSDADVSRYIWSALCTQGALKRQFWQQIYHALFN